MVSQQDDTLSRLWRDIILNLTSSTPATPLHQQYLDSQARLCYAAQSGCTRHQFKLRHGEVVFLTDRERQIVYFLHHAMTATAIAEQIDLSPRTVEYYTDNLKMKFQVTSKKALVQRLVQETELLHACDFGLHPRRPG